MSLSDILGSALSGLNAAQAGLRSTSNNIANVNTPGYAREKVNLQAAVAGGRVSGVLAGEAERVADRFLEANVYRRSGDWGRAEAVADYLGRLQSFLGVPGASSGLPARINAVSAAALAMTGAAGAEQNSRDFTSKVQDAVTGLQQLDADVTTLRQDAETEVGFTVARINDLLRRIGDLNDSVARQAALGRATGGATDLRMSAVEELSGLIKVNVLEQADGRLFVETPAGVSLVDRRVRQLSYPSGGGAAQPVYPAMTVHFMAEDGTLGAPTGERLDSPALGGKLGGLLELRDGLLPGFQRELGTLFAGLVDPLNAASNAGTTVPAPRQLTGSQTGLTALDRLGFAGRIHVTVLSSTSEIVASTLVDFDALGTNATVQDAVNAINAGLGGAATATFNNGRLMLAATSATQGVAISQDQTTPAVRAGMGFAHYFGLNDLVASSISTQAAGLVGSDPHGFASDSSVQFILRDRSGHLLAEQSLAPVSGGTINDLMSALNAGSCAAFGAFSLGAAGELVFGPSASAAAASLSVSNDSTDRHGTGRSFSSLFAVPTADPAWRETSVRSDVIANPAKLPLARLNLGAAPGSPVIGRGDTRGATDFTDRLQSPLTRADGSLGLSLENLTTSVLGKAGLAAAHAADRLDDAEARRSEAVGRRDSYSGVNVDEELAQLVTLQNSYSAAARVMTTATQMYDTLLDMVK